MPYLDLDDYDNYVHLCQLFFAAHPAYRETNEAIRADATMPGQYFFTPDMTREMATWARQRHLITRKVAARLLDIAARLLADPASVVSLSPRILGTPPRLQPTVLGSEVFAWLFVCAPPQDPGTEDYVMTVEAAMTLLHNHADDDAQSGEVRARARQLIAWLQEQCEE